MHCTALQATLHPCTLHPAPCTLQPLTALQPLGSPSFIPLTWYRCFIFNPSQANGLYAGNIAMSSCCSLQLSDPRLPFFYCARHSMSQAIMYYVKRLTMSTPLILQSGWIYTMTRQHSAPLHAQAGRSRQHACRPRALPPRQPTCHQDSTPSSILSSHAPGEIGKAGIRNSTIRMQKKTSATATVVQCHTKLNSTWPLPGSVMRCRHWHAAKMARPSHITCLFLL